MLLASLQGQLQSRYDLHLPYEIQHFVSCDRRVADHLADEQAIAGHERPIVDEEVVFIRQQHDTFEFTVYFEEQLLAAVSNQRSDLDGMCTVVEGASHAVCLLWHAHNERQLRPVDLELQAEIDKFMILSEGHAAPLARKKLLRQLFANSRIVQCPGTDLHDRYRTASQLAALYCQWLDNRYDGQWQGVALDQELARFYRLSGRAKFDYIKRLH